MLVGLCLYFFFLQSFLSSYAGSWLDGVFFEMLVCSCLAFPPLHVCLPFVPGAFPSHISPIDSSLYFPLIIFVMGL